MKPIKVISDCVTKIEVFKKCKEIFFDYLLIECMRLNEVVFENVVNWISKFEKTPAAGNPNYHGCFKGGLFIHSILVTLQMIELFKNVDLFSEAKIKNPIDSIIFMGIFHDIGKIGRINRKSSHIEDYYLPSSNGWYKINQMLPSHAVLSIWNLNELNLSYTFDEYLAILFHNGPYDKGFKSNMIGKENWSYLLLHTADMLISRKLEPIIQQLPESIRRF